MILLLSLYLTPVPYALSVESGKRESDHHEVKMHHLRTGKTATKAE